MMPTDLIAMLNATGHYWMIGRGRTHPNEKLFGCLIQEALDNGRVLATTEGDDADYLIVRFDETRWGETHAHLLIVAKRDASDLARDDDEDEDAEAA